MNKTRDNVIDKTTKNSGSLIEFHDTSPTLANNGDGISLIVFGFTGATIFFNPKTAPELTKKIGLLLRNYSGFVLSYNWNTHHHLVHNLFHLNPTKTFNLKKMAEANF